MDKYPHKCYQLWGCFICPIFPDEFIIIVLLLFSPEDDPSLKIAEIKRNSFDIASLHWLVFLATCFVLLFKFRQWVSSKI